MVKVGPPAITAFSLSPMLLPSSLFFSSFTSFFSFSYIFLLHPFLLFLSNTGLFATLLSAFGSTLGVSSFQHRWLIPAFRHVYSKL
jgi:hypothetical protein